MPLDRIVTAALSIVDEGGAEALSMRALALRLNSGTATLYRHFAGRVDLVGQVVDRMFGEVELDPQELTAMTWQELYGTVAHRMFAALGQHRNAASLLVEHVPTGPNALALRETCLAGLLNSGFSPRLAAHAYATLARYVLGFAIQMKDQKHPRGRQAEEQELSALFHDLDPSTFPATVAAADSLPVSLEDEFAFGLDLIINGLERVRDAEKPRRRVAR